MLPMLPRILVFFEARFFASLRIADQPPGMRGAQNTAYSSLTFGLTAAGDAEIRIPQLHIAVQ